MGQGKGPAVGDERFWGWEAFKQAFVCGWALTLPPFFLSVPPLKLAPTTQPRVCSSFPLVWPPPQF